VTGNDAPGCILQFAGVRSVAVLGDALPPVGATLERVCRVIPETGSLREKTDWSPTDRFHLLFEFVDGRSVEVDADTVTLVRVAD
jgi:hypothetical protein